MSNRYKSSEEFQEKYGEENPQIRDEWISKRAKQILKEDPLSDARMSWDQASREWEEKQKERESSERIRRLQEESSRRIIQQIADAQRTSAVAQNNPSKTAASLPELAPGSGVYVDNSGKTTVFRDKEGKIINQAEAQKRAVRASTKELEPFEEKRRAAEAAAAKRKAAEEAKPITKYLKNTQSLMFNKMYENFGGTKEFDFSGPEKIYRIPTSTKQGGSYTQRLATEQLFSSGKSSFLQATPAQLASLVPLLRFFLTDNQGYQKEIFFSDKVSTQHIKTISELKGKSIDDILNYNAKGGGEAGIKSFTWNYNNKHEGDYIIEADLELYFGTLVELSNQEYLNFLFPTGRDNDFAGDLKQASASARASNVSRQTTSAAANRSNLLKKLKNKIDKYNDLEKGNEKLRSMWGGMKPEKEKNHLQLKVVVGWSLPEGKESQLQTLFPGGSLRHFREEVKRTQTAILLNLADYNVDFTQEGPTTLKLKYFGSSDNYLAQEKSDIFGTNNYTSKVMYKDTLVSLEGILESNNKLSDSKADSKTTKTKAGINPRTIVDSDLYLKAVTKVDLDRDVYGERVATVQLAGLKLAQERVTLEIKLEEAKQTDPEDPIFKKLRRRGQYLVLLYQRALAIRLRDMYSSFLDDMIDQKIIKIATIDLIPSSEGGKKVKVTTDPKKTARRVTAKENIKANEEKIEEANSSSSLAAQFLNYVTRAVQSGADAIERAQNKETSFDTYYCFLGDIIRIMMKSADLADDITLLLGNFEDINDNAFSIYKIPITIESFGEFFYNRIVARKVTSYPFRTFLNDFLNFTARLMNQNPQTSERISFDYTVFTSTFRNITTGPDRLLVVDPKQGINQIRDIRNGVHDPLTNAYSKKKYQSYYAIFVKKTSFGRRTGNFEQDKRDGIFHYTVGSDRGLAKKFNFSRQETDYFQEMLIESNNPSDRIQALFLPQNVDIEMYGNGIHRNGDLVFVDTRAALGDYASQILGIGGYYRVVRSSHKITNRGYNTTLTCVFELRVGRRK